MAMTELTDLGRLKCTDPGSKALVFHLEKETDRTVALVQLQVSPQLVLLSLRSPL